MIELYLIGVISEVSMFVKSGYAPGILYSPPRELILDFDATDDPTHGQQEQTFFMVIIAIIVFLPLYIFCKDQLLS